MSYLIIARVIWVSGGIQDLKERGKVWMADPVTYSCVYLIVPVDLSVLRHMKMVTLDYTYKYTGGDWFGNNTLDAKCSRSQPGKGQFLPSILLFVVLDVFHFVGLISISLHFYLEYLKKKTEDSMVILVIS